MNYKLNVITSKRERTYSSEDVLLLWKKEEFKNYILSSEFNTLNVEELKITKKISLTNFKQMFNDGKYSHIITDDAKIAKIAKSYFNIYYYKKGTDATTGEVILYNDESFLTNINQYDKNRYHFIKNEENVELVNYLKDNRKSLNKIVKINNNEIEVAIKIDGTWLIKENNDLENYFSIKSNFKIDESPLSKNKNNNSLVSYGIDGMIYNEDYASNQYQSKKINWIISDSFVANVENIKRERGVLVRDSRVIKLNEKNNFEKFISLAKEKSEFNGIPYDSFSVENDVYIFNFPEGKFYIRKNEDSFTLSCSFDSKMKEHDILKYVNGLFINIGNHINNEVSVTRLSKGNIIKSFIGLIILIVLFAMTFTFVFDVENINFLFKSFLNVNTWNSPWMYLILTSFLFSFFMPFFLALFIERVVMKKDKVDWDRAKVYFIAGAMRNASTFLTGNAFIAMFIWGWYLTRKLEIRTTTLIGSIGMVSAIRAIVIFGVGMVFMLSGTISYLLYYNPNPSGQTITVICIAWLGFLWNVLYNFWIYILLVSPFIAKMIINSKLWLSKKTLSKNRINNAHYDNLSFMNTKLKLNWRENKVAVVRVISLTMIPIVLEGLETLYYFNYVDHVILWNLGLQDEFKLYYNFLSIPGLRYMANQIHHFPIINILPGRGLFFSEFGMNSLYEAIYTKHHGSYEWVGGYNSGDLAQITAFTTRFFNTYLNTSILLIVAIVAIAKEIFNRKKNIKSIKNEIYD